ncbi:DUF4287 domain-containing protein [Lacimicrobium alkaliphilum]|uniref:DUF4287 domain-containing protein n=1 Tax=Lacimicrobium alkaliphilum TaxID=1526571 RepID=A0A0U3AZ59_9ALTE|nr:DUF4287 domain-containing protein [Lacimicrobium alkaliphilum]ALS98248.1 hypothetical protein AT746_08300 [Lacimicrobium alkaliphilum]
MSDEKNVKGPASYFPSIEKKHGFEINHWFNLLKQQKHMDMVTWLKNEHELGHGHANALVAHLRSKEGL